MIMDCRLALILLLCAATLVQADGLPRLGSDANGGPVFEAAGAKHVFWGIDADTWGCDAGNLDHFR